MIQITIFKNQQSYQGITCSGHALFEQAGKDIVCASVSILVINTLNAIEQFTEDGFTLDTKGMDANSKKRFFQRNVENDNYIKFQFEDDFISEKATVLFDSLVLGLTEIQKVYGNSYLALYFEEV